MHSSLRERVRRLAYGARKQNRELELQGRALVLCPPDCPRAHRGVEHAHTWWDMYRMAPAAEYAASLARAQREAAQRSRVDVVAHLRRMGVGAKHLGALTSLDETRAPLRAVRLWLAQPRPLLPADAHQPARHGPMPFPWLVLMGQPDAGKTQAAVVVLADFARHYPWNQAAGGGRQMPPALFVPGAELAGLSAFTDAGRERLEDMRRCRLLVLDDVGAEKLGDVALGLLHDVLDARYREQRRTVLTTHLNRQDFLARFDGREAGLPAENLGRLERRIRELAFTLQGTGNKPHLSCGGRPLRLT
ncbi:hypothetical protein SAMN04488504_109302 [Myxococcus virescens]|nr:hypothetical protein SAMN04488504_109302 [Myxococcus virescens]